MIIPKAFSAHEADFLVAYRELCARFDMCPVVEAQGQVGLIDFSESRIWGCTASQMVDKQIEEMARLLPPPTEHRGF
jgi:hypothetical protein